MWDGEPLFVDVFVQARQRGMSRPRASMRILLPTASMTSTLGTLPDGVEGMSALKSAHHRADIDQIAAQLRVHGLLERRDFHLLSPAGS